MLRKKRGDMKTGIIIALAMVAVLATGIAIGLFVVMAKSNASQTAVASQNQPAVATPVNSVNTPVPILAEEDAPQTGNTPKNLNENASPTSVPTPQTPLDSNVRKKNELEKEFNELRSHMTSEVDEVTGVKFIQNKKRKDVNSDPLTFYVYLGQKGNNTWPCLYTSFLNIGDAVRADEIIINADGKVFKMDGYDIHRARKIDSEYIGGKGFYTVSYNFTAKQYLDILKAVAFSKKVLVRFNDTTFHKQEDYTLSAGQIEDIKKIIRLHDIFNELEKM